MLTHIHTTAILQVQGSHALALIVELIREVGPATEQLCQVNFLAASDASGNLEEHVYSSDLHSFGQSQSMPAAAEAGYQQPCSFSKLMSEFHTRSSTQSTNTSDIALTASCARMLDRGESNDWHELVSYLRVDLWGTEVSEADHQALRRPARHEQLGRQERVSDRGQSPPIMKPKSLVSTHCVNF